MKNEDALFEKFELPQRGFQAKRQMAADRDALFEKFEVAQPAQEPVAHLWECLGKWSAYLVTNGKQADCAPPSWLVEAIQNATAPPKREWAGLTGEDRKAALLTAYKEWECEELLLCAREDYLLIEQALKEKNNG